MQQQSQFSPITMFRPIPQYSIYAETISIELSSSGYSRSSQVGSDMGIIKPEKKSLPAENFIKFQRKNQRLSDLSSSVSVKFGESGKGDQQGKQRIIDMQIFKQEDERLQNESSLSCSKDSSFVQSYKLPNTLICRQRLSQGSTNNKAYENILGSLANQSSKKSLLNKQSFGQSSIYQKQTPNPFSSLSSQDHEYQKMLSTMQTQLKTKQSQQTRESYNNIQTGQSQSNTEKQKNISPSYDFSTFQEDETESKIQKYRNIDICKLIAFFIISIMWQIGLYFTLTQIMPVPEYLHYFALVATSTSIAFIVLLNQCCLTRKNQIYLNQLNLFKDVRRIKKIRRGVIFLQITVILLVIFVLRTYF